MTHRFPALVLIAAVLAPAMLVARPVTAAATAPTFSDAALKPFFAADGALMVGPDWYGHTRPGGEWGRATDIGSAQGHVNTTYDAPMPAPAVDLSAETVGAAHQTNTWAYWATQWRESTTTLPAYDELDCVWIRPGQGNGENMLFTQSDPRLNPVRVEPVARTMYAVTYDGYQTIDLGAWQTEDGAGVAVNVKVPVAWVGTDPPHGAASYHQVCLSELIGVGQGGQPDSTVSGWIDGVQVLHATGINVGLIQGQVRIVGLRYCAGDLVCVGGSQNSSTGLDFLGDIAYMGYLNGAAAGNEGLVARMTLPCGASGGLPQWYRGGPGPSEPWNYCNASDPNATWIRTMAQAAGGTVDTAHPGCEGTACNPGGTYTPPPAPSGQCDGVATIGLLSGQPKYQICDIAPISLENVVTPQACTEGGWTDPGSWVPYLACQIAYNSSTLVRVVIVAFGQPLVDAAVAATNATAVHGANALLDLIVPSDNVFTPVATIGSSLESRVPVAYAVQAVGMVRLALGVAPVSTWSAVIHLGRLGPTLDLSVLASTAPDNPLDVLDQWRLWLVFVIFATTLLGLWHYGIETMTR